MGLERHSPCGDTELCSLHTCAPCWSLNWRYTGTKLHQNEVTQDFLKQPMSGLERLRSLVDAVAARVIARPFLLDSASD